MKFSTKLFGFDKQGNRFCQERSTIEATLDRKINIDPIIILENPKTMNTREFKFTKCDMDGSHEDIYGWNFISNDGIELLIIND